MPGSLSALLELQLGRESNQALGFAAHVPHYLATIDHPRSALTLLTEVMGATGLVLPLDALREAAEEIALPIGATISAIVRGERDFQPDPPDDRVLAAGEHLIASGTAEKLRALRARA